MRIERETNIGSVRLTNQDSCDCGIFSENSVWGIVCDGMGGANAGNVASKMAMEKIKAFMITNYYEGMSDGNIKAMLLNAISRANTVVYEASHSNDEYFGMGTTAVVVIAEGSKVHVAHVGDSRAYLMNKEGLTRLTTDHSFVQNLIDFGQITETEARVHPKRNVITRAVGVHHTVEADYTEADFNKGDTVVACTDGLTGYMADETLGEYISKYSGKTLTEKLIRYAVDAGGADNITVITVSNDD